MQSPIRWGILGCGDVTEVKSGPGFQLASGSRLTAVMRRNATLAESYATRHGVEAWYTDADALINDDNVDAVYIATPPGSHLELALKVCAASKPVYVEKPMARNYTECKAMADAFAAANIPLFTAYYRRALDRFVHARNVIANGDIGGVTHIQIRYACPAKPYTAENLPWRLQAEHAGGGLFLDLGCHTLDIVAFMAGEIVESSGFASRMAGPYMVEDTVTLSFKTETGACGSASWCFAADRSEDLIEINGTKGRLLITTFGNDPLTVEAGNNMRIYDLPNPVHIQLPMIQSIVDHLLGHGLSPSTGTSGAITSRVMDSALEEFYGGRADEFWNRPATWKR